MSSLRRNLGSFFLLLAGIGFILLVWAMFDEWRGVVERYEVRQRSQIATLHTATHNVMASQEMVLDLLGRELLVADAGELDDAGVRLLDRLREINPRVAGYGLADPDGKLLVVNSDFELEALPNLLEQAPSSESFREALASEHMVIGRAYRMPALNEWVVPLRKAVRNAQGEVLGVMTAGLALDGADPFFGEELFIGLRNVIQIVRGSDLYPLHWASSIARPDGYFGAPIPRDYYENAVASAERLSGLGIEQIKASGRPVHYWVVNALGPHFGTAAYDPVYDYWVLTQTHRNQLMGDFARTAGVYVAVYLLLVLVFFAALRAIGRIEQHRRAELQQRADHDALTGLPNRQRLHDDFEQIRKMHGDRIALLFIDLDNFKAFNDGFGHSLGDDLLRQMGRRLRRLTVPGECIARIGGDEFVLLCAETDRERLAGRARALIDELTRPFSINDMRFELGCSIGIARLEDAGNSIGDLLRAADIAMYEAKHQQNAWRFYAPEMGSRYLENVRIEQRLRAAIDNGEIRMVYQPQFDMQGRMVGIEALARWHDAELGDIAPRRFIAIAEASGLIGRLGDYIIERCLDEVGRLGDRIDGTLHLSINISLRQFLMPEFSTSMLKRLERVKLSGIRIVLELTESLFMEDRDQVTAQLEQLRLREVRISLDDFGTGFSSLSLLKDLPVDELKIDRSFIASLDDDPYSRSLVRSIIAIGKTHGMSLMAEGVESQGQFEALREDGCDAVQGFLFARPMPIDELEALLARNDSRAAGAGPD